MKPIVIVSGGFDPVHRGHIEHFQEAAQLGTVIVGLNSDARLTRKKGKPFLSREERKIILSEFRSISEVIAFEDSDGSACDAIRQVHEKFKDSAQKIIFANGGDRTADNIPEKDFCEKHGIEILYGIGKSGKIQSSSRVLENRK